MSLFSLIAGLAMPSASDVLGSNGMSQRFGASPFAPGPNPFEGLRRRFSDNSTPGSNGMPGGVPDFGLIDPGEADIGRQMLQNFGQNHVPGGGRMPAPTVPGAPAELMPAPQLQDRDNAMRHGPDAVWPDATNPQNWVDTGFQLRTNKGGVKASDRGNPPVPNNQNLDRPIAPQNDNKIGVIKASAGRNTDKPNPYGVSEAQWQAMNAPDTGAKPKPDPMIVTGKAATRPYIPRSTAPDIELMNRYLPHIRGAESGGNDRAKNPSSTALGRYQFLQGTWNEVARKHPELHLTPNGRTDPDQQERAIRAFTQDNINYLRRAGIPVEPGSIYAAHFLGAGGAGDVYNSPSGASMASVVDDSVVKANPFLAHMTVGQFKAWASRKMGAPITNQATGDASAAENASQPTQGASGLQFSPEKAPGFAPEQGQQGAGGGSGGARGQQSAEEGVQAARPQTHAERLAVLRQFMALAGFTPEEIG